MAVIYYFLHLGVATNQIKINCWLLQFALVLSTRLVAYAVQQTNILLPIKPGTGGNFVLLNLGINGN